MNHPMTANEVRAARAAYGLTARDLAHILDVNERTVRRWENGTAHPNGAVAAEIRALDTRVDRIADDIALAAPYDLTTTPSETWGRTTPGLIRAAAWRAHVHHGARII